MCGLIVVSGMQHRSEHEAAEMAARYGAGFGYGKNFCEVRRSSDGLRADNNR